MCCAGSPPSLLNVLIRLLTKPVLATLARQVGDHARGTLATLFSTALEATASLDTAIGFLPGLRSYDQTSTLAAIRAQTIVISGGADLLTPPSHSRDIAAAIPGATHVHLPMAGHMLPHEAADAVTDAISRTIATGSGARPTLAHIAEYIGDAVTEQREVAA